MVAQNSSDPNEDFYLSIIDDPTFWLGLAVMGFILATVIVIGNSFLVFTTYKDPRKSLRTPPSFLIANLGVSDLLLGMFTVFLVAVRDVYRYKQVHMPFVVGFKALMYTVLITTMFVSSNSIIALSGACYVAINKPVDYKNIISKRRTKIYIAVLWLISISTCVLPVTGVSEKTYTMIYLHTHASLPAMLLTVIYVKVFRAIARRTRELHLNGIVSAINSAYVLERERVMSVTIIIILSMFFITFLPQYITLHLLYFCKVCQQSITFHKIDVALSRFLFINSAINPFIYAWRIPRYRRAFMDCWKILLKRRRQVLSLDGRTSGGTSLGSRRTEQTERSLTYLGNTHPEESKHNSRQSECTWI